MPRSSAAAAHLARSLPAFSPTRLQATRPNWGLNELDFVFATLVVGCIINFSAVYLLAPVAASGGAAQASFLTKLFGDHYLLKWGAPSERFAWLPASSSLILQCLSVGCPSRQPCINTRRSGGSTNSCAHHTCGQLPAGGLASARRSPGVFPFRLGANTVCCRLRCHRVVPAAAHARGLLSGSHVSSYAAATPLCHAPSLVPPQPGTSSSRALASAPASPTISIRCWAACSFVWLALLCMVGCFFV